LNPEPIRIRIRNTANNQDSLKRNWYLKSAADLAILDVGALLQILEAQLVCFVKLQQAQG
jgi:hypothetical protein